MVTQTSVLKLKCANSLSRHCNCHVKHWLPLPHCRFWTTFPLWSWCYYFCRGWNNSQCRCSPPSCHYTTSLSASNCQITYRKQGIRWGQWDSVSQSPKIVENKKLHQTAWGWSKCTEQNGQHIIVCWKVFIHIWSFHRARGILPWYLHNWLFH